MTSPPAFGAVVIGRNEGERLRICLQSVLRSTPAVVYVDSGSTDGSLTLAASLGVDVLQLDMSIPFTAARARNAGYRRLLQIAPGVPLVQFVDGDCEVVAGWTDKAVARLAERPDLAVVCGRRRERHPDASVYNRLCDIEWDTPIGDTAACGGDAMMRLAALEAVGGYDPQLIAGEEPELCVRLCKRGYRIERLDAEMTLHDAAITRFSQWWRRNVRAGHAFSEGASLHGRGADRHGVRNVRSAIFWGGAVPTVALLGAVPSGGASLVLFGGYGLLALRVYRRQRRQGRPPRDAAVAATFIVLAKFPELRGVIKFHWNRARGQRSPLIEYKLPVQPKS